MSQVKGTVDLEALANTNAPNLIQNYLPQTLLLSIKTKNLQFQVPDRGLLVKPANFDIKIHETKNNQGDIKIGIAGLQQLSGLELSTTDGDAKSQLQLNDIKFSVNSELHYPRTNSSNMNLDATIADGVFQKNDLPPIHLPMAISLHATDKGEGEVTSAKIKADLGTISTATIEASCEKDCETFSLEAHQSTPSFGQIWSMIEPLATRMIPPKYLPETLIGEQFIDVSINGTITGGLRQKPNTNRIFQCRQSQNRRPDVGLHEKPLPFSWHYFATSDRTAQRFTVQRKFARTQRPTLDLSSVVATTATRIHLCGPDIDDKIP